MRALITLATCIGVGALLVLDNPEGSRALSGALFTRVSHLWHDKELRLDGLRLLSRADIEKTLPLDRSVMWWHLNATEVQAHLSRNTWVEKAELTSCRDSWASRWGCFVLNIKERQPMFLANVDGNAWVIDREGSFLVPHGELASRKYSGRLITVKGAASANAPDVVRAQLSAASRLCDTVEREVGKSVRELEFLGQGDFSVVFEGLPFPVVFAAGKDAKVPLPEQALRCASLLRQLRSRLADVAKIDLAFDRVGVVQFRPVAATQEQPAAG